MHALALIIIGWISLNVGFIGAALYSAWSSGR